MKRNLAKIALTAAIFTLVAAGVGPAYAQPKELPPKQVPIRPKLSKATTEILELSQSGVGDNVLLDVIKKSKSGYNLTPDTITYLKAAGLSQVLVDAMQKHDGKGDTKTKKSVPPGERKPVILPTPKESQPTAAEDEKPLPKRLSSVVIDQKPPTPKLEVVPTPPGTNYAWLPGYWFYRGGEWTWNAGHWELKPYEAASYVNGYWAPHGRGYIWVKGYWR